MKKYFLLPVILIAAILFGCTAAPEAEVTDPAPIQTEPETQAPTEALIDNQQALEIALQSSGLVALDASIELTTHVVLSNDVILDGCDFTLTAPTYTEGQPNTENAVTMRSGRLKNITIQGGYRCLGDNGGGSQTGTVRLENVTVDGPTYALNFGHGNFTGKLIADDSKFYGWSSYTGFAEVAFTGCTFGWDSTGSNGNLRPYVDTVLIGCHFEGKTAEDGTLEPFGIVLKENITGITISMEDCYVGDTLITEENVEELLNIKLFDNTLYISNSEG